MRIRRMDTAGAVLRACGSWCRIASVALLPLGVAACTTTGLNAGSGTDTHGITVAFESVDGPPPTVVQEIVRDLNAEATARQLLVVEGGGQAMYRVRGYLASHGEAAGTAIVWAWDIYDADERHVFRLQGADKATDRRAWSAADATTLRRIARASIDQLVAFLAAPRTAALPAPQPAGAGEPPRGLSIRAGIDAGIDDVRPEAGMVLWFRPARSALALGTADPAPIGDPLLKRRSASGGTSATALAYTDTGE